MLSRVPPLRSNGIFAKESVEKKRLEGRAKRLEKLLVDARERADERDFHVSGCSRICIVVVVVVISWPMIIR